MNKARTLALITIRILIGTYLSHGKVMAADITVDSASSSTQTLTGEQSLVITETGIVSITNANSRGVDSSGDANSINVNGSIIVTGDRTYAINLNGSDNSVNLTGAIQGAGSYVRGISNAIGEGNTIVVDGGISLVGNYTQGIQARGNSTVTVDGEISLVGNYTQGIQASALADIGNSSVTVNGSITGAGFGAVGIASYGDSGQINLGGSLSLLGDSTVGIDTSGDFVYIGITGSLSTEGTNPRGVTVRGDSVTLAISGVIHVTGTNPLAVDIAAGYEGNRVYVQRGARLVGGIAVDDAASLLFDVGSAMSYVYDTTGSWTLEDLDGRAVVSGSAMAAGIGNAETADEVQFDRLSRLNQGIRLMPTVTADSPRSAWAMPYGFSSKRSASASDPTVTKYKSNAYGIVAGRPISRWGDKADLVIQLDQNDLDIDDADQTIKTTTARVGLLASQLAQVKGFDLSARALVGYNQYDSTRKVLVNTNTTTGLTTYDASFKSWELLIGGSANRAFQLTANTQLNTKARLDLAYESISAYSEGGYFSWKNRKLLQSVAGLSTELERQHTPKLRSKVSLLLDRRNLISGKTADYAINGTNVSFTGGDTTDTIATLGLGLTYKAKKNLTLTTDFTTSRSNNSLTSKSAQLRVNYQF